VEKNAPLRLDAVKGIHHPTIARVHISKGWDIILRGKNGGYLSDIKMLYVTCGNTLNQTCNSNRGVEAMKKLEFIVVHEQFMTPTARFADILLPICTWCERNDILLPWGGFGYYVLSVNKAIEPMYESKSDLEIFTELAKRMGISGYNERTEEEWQRFIAQKHSVTDFDSLKKDGLYLFELPEPYVAFSDQIRNPDKNPFPTPSGKIEIYSQRIADVNMPETLPAIPKYIEMWEGPNDPLRKRFPLRLITPHSRKRTHSQFHNIGWFQSLEPHTVWISTVDAKVRGIKNKDEVKVFNNRGAVLLKAKVTERIMPGVVSIYQGAWYGGDGSGIDPGGCANTLTRDETSPAGAFAHNTSLVEVEKNRR
jgi:anaerobic dimethyl sulfoxide reductase subunit A